MRMHMVILMQPDLDKAVAFYLEMGLKIAFHVPGKWAELLLEDGVKIGLCPMDPSKPAGRSRAKDEVAERRTGAVFHVADVAKMYEDLRDKITFIHEPVTKPHGVMVSCKDPGGNIIDLYQPTPELLEKVMKAHDAHVASHKNDANGVAKGCQKPGGCACAARRAKSEPVART